GRAPGQDARRLPDQYLLRRTRPAHRVHHLVGDRAARRDGMARAGTAAQFPGVSGMLIEIICTGDEVLTGKIVNTNFSYIAQKLEDVGLTARWGITVGDDRDTLLDAFLHAGERADAVIVNGGLGPTV